LKQPVIQNDEMLLMNAWLAGVTGALEYLPMKMENIWSHYLAAFSMSPTPFIKKDTSPPSEINLNPR